MSKNAQKKPFKRPADHPPYSEMIKVALLALKERSGSSRQAIEKYIKANYSIGDVGSHLKMALKRMAARGKLVQTKGVGASGSFKLAKEEKKPVKKEPPKKKPAAKPKKPIAKKPEAKKKPVEKRVSAKAIVKQNSPKKRPVKKPVDNKTAIDKRSPKKAGKKLAAKKNTTKAAAKEAKTKKWAAA